MAYGKRRVTYLTVGHRPSIIGRDVLSAQPQLLDDGAVPLRVLVLQVRKMPAPLADQLVEAASRMVVVLVHLQVLGQLADPGGQKGNLHLRRTCVTGMNVEFRNNIRLFGFR